MLNLMQYVDQNCNQRPMKPMSLWSVPC